MKTEATAYLEKSKAFFVKAEGMLRNGWADEAGRAAYLAGFHAAQALIFEWSGRVSKTHSGVRSEFARLTKDSPAFDSEARRFLGRAYTLKVSADYETGPNSDVSPELALEAIDVANRFVSIIVGLISTGDQKSGDVGGGIE